MLIVGLVSFVLGLVIRTGPGSVRLGGGDRDHRPRGPARRAVAQMISATREERVLIVTGIIAGFVGLALGLAHGGFAG